MKVLFRVLPFALIAAVFLAIFLLPTEDKGDVSPQKTMVEVWNVDTFEGGKGSRTSFLSDIAARVDEDVYFYVLSYTADGVEEAFSRGVFPDMISFGVGMEGIAERALPLPYSDKGGEIGGKCLAVPWAAGKYFLFSADDSMGDGAIAISCGGKNLSAASAALHGVKGVELPSTEAYVSFLNGDYSRLLGTQRDVCRFLSRGVTVKSEALTEYNDLFQYISVFSAEKRELCLRLVEELLSERTQGELSKIGMYPPSEIGNCLTPSVFTSSEALATMQKAAREGDVKNLEKYLKSR